MKAQFVVWWFETDSFSGKVSRVYRDFVNEHSAIAFAGGSQDRHIGTIANCSWHHSHGSISLANAGQCSQPE